MLDWLSFPHIFEAVLSYASDEVLLAMRATSRGVHALANAVLFDHIVATYQQPLVRHTMITAPYNPVYVISIRPFGSKLSFEWADLNVVPMKPPPSREDVRAGQRLRRFVREMVRKARVFDYYLGWETDKRVRYVTKAAERRWGLLNRCIEHRTRFDTRGVISTKVPDKSQPRVSVAGTPILLNKKSRPALRGYSTMNEILTMLITLTTYPDDSAHTEQAPSSAVIHLIDDGKKCGRKGRIGKWRGPMSAPFLACFAHAAVWWQYHKNLTVTVVGGPKLCREAVGAPLGASEDEFYAASDAFILQQSMPSPSLAAYFGHDDLFYEYDGIPVTEVIALWRDHIRFVAPEVYLAEVGAERFALETKLNPYVGPLVEYLK